jgi:hypothetical protein
MSLTITVKCISCRMRRELMSAEVEGVNVVLCSRCGMPCVAVSATAR